MMKTLHDRKIQGYTSIGYKVIADDGHKTTLAYVPYSQKFVKLAEIENGRAKSSIILSLKDLKVLNNRLNIPSHPMKKKKRY
ncbi:hypothetical protein D3C74_236650 [compost metagenome]